MFGRKFVTVWNMPSPIRRGVVGSNLRQISQNLAAVWVEADVFFIGQNSADCDPIHNEGWHAVLDNFISGWKKFEDLSSKD